ncbi:hypothetical protein D3C84_820850 [compost metagenome]
MERQRKRTARQIFAVHTRRIYFGCLRFAARPHEYIKAVVAQHSSQRSSPATCDKHSRFALTRYFLIRHLFNLSSLRTNLVLFPLHKLHKIGTVPYESEHAY